MDARVTETMKLLLECFMTSLKGGNNNLASFLRYWVPLKDTLQSHHDDLKEDTLAYAHNLVSTIGTITSGMLELEVERDTMQRELMQELSHILNEDMENLVIRDEMPISKVLDSIPVYVKPCCQWLLNNLHNPYPAKSVRNSICRQTGYSIKDIDAWFVDARKRIGWNQLRRTHFANKRERIIDAATSFFKPYRTFVIGNALHEFPLAGLTDYSMIFIEMEECARRLFSDKFEETSLARTIDVVQDPSRPSQNHIFTQSQNQQTSTVFKLNRYTYPSPEQSPESSPGPIPSSIIAIPEPLTSPFSSHKRRRSLSEVRVDNTSPDRSQKRLRSINAHDFNNISAAASLPSPAASITEFPFPTGSDLLFSNSATCHPDQIATAPFTDETPNVATQFPVSVKRKRASSESEDFRPSKYSQPASLSRIASDPLPISNQTLDISSSQDLVPKYTLHQKLLFDKPPPGSHVMRNGSASFDINYHQIPPFMPNDSLHTEGALQEFSLQESINSSSPQSESDAWAEALREYELHDFMMAENSIYSELTPLELEPDFFTGMPALEKFFDPTSSAIDWTGFVNQPLDTQIASQVELGMVFNEPNSAPTSTRPPTTTELAAKRQRAEILRAELRQLEADLD
uniref:Homeodomain protein n=1 Tax=Pholiota microspora TaxID=1538424 RepID=B9A1S1_PHOMI|nr:homeodomain protein [Pholiota nameko]